MKISLKWLNDYVEVADFFKDAKPLANRLTGAGLEAEAVEELGKSLDNVIVGHIIELAKHPNADRLTVCQVDTGQGDVRQIVCGAKNHRQGDRVVVALPGAILPGNFAIKESKIRDVESKGMLCSESELGLKDEAEGILILPKDAPVGESFAAYYGLDDVVMELNVTPNRADCLSHLGLAREVGCLFDRKVKVPVPKFVAGSVSTSQTVALELKDSKNCPRYSGRVIKGVKIGPSPEWLKQRLRAVGLNSINNVVDVTNYVMFELGQPLHAFDIRSLKGSRILIDRAKAGESFVSFDGTQFKLQGDELAIRDGERVVALAGIIGGKNSGVVDDTTDLFIESAHFLAESVRRTMRRLGIQTDSSYRFSRGTDPEQVVLALERACELIQSVAGGEIAKDHYDEYPHRIPEKRIAVKIEEVSQRLGYEVTKSTFEKIMNRLGCAVKLSGSLYEVTPPPYRVDLGAKMDIVEEIGRLEGYDKIPETFPSLQYSPLQHAPDFVSEVRLIDDLVEAGFQQTVNYGFVSSRFQSEFLGAVAPLTDVGLETPAEAVKIRNPLNEELDVMRVSLVPGLFKNLIDNYRQSNDCGRLFELGQAFRKVESGYAEQKRLGLMAWGQRHGLWQGDKERPVVFDLKSAVEDVLERLGISSYQWQSVKVAPSFLHPAQCATLVCEGRAIGVMGSLHPAWLEKEKIRLSVAVAELDVAKLMRGQPKVPKAAPIVRFPPVARDMALVLPEDRAAGDVIREIKKAGGQLVRSVEAFDVFRGGSLPAGHKSVAFRFVLQDTEGTLTDEKISQVQANILKVVAEKLNLKVRS